MWDLSCKTSWSNVYYCIRKSFEPMWFAFLYPRNAVLQERRWQISYPEFSWSGKKYSGRQERSWAREDGSLPPRESTPVRTAEKQTQGLASGRIRSLEVLFKIPFKAILSCLQTFTKKIIANWIMLVKLAYLTKGNFQSTFSFSFLDFSFLYVIILVKFGGEPFVICWSKVPTENSYIYS